MEKLIIELLQDDGERLNRASCWTESCINVCDSGRDGDEEDMPEEVERTLESIREARVGKKVYFGDENLDGDMESEAPWAGLSDTDGF